jgi:hypothetical protein
LSTENLHALAALIRRERDTLLARWREEVRQLAGAHELDVPTLNNHIPDLLEELADELEAHTDESMVGELKKTSVVHGLDRLRLGFDVEEVVAEYNALRGVIQDLIERHDLSLRGPVNRTINRVLHPEWGSYCRGAYGRRVGRRRMLGRRRRRGDSGRPSGEGVRQIRERSRQEKRHGARPRHRQAVRRSARRPGLRRKRTRPGLDFPLHNSLEYVSTTVGRRFSARERDHLHKRKAVTK